MSNRIEAVRREKENSEKKWLGKPHVDWDKLAKEWGVPAWKPVEGENFISIIPPEDDNKYFGVKIQVHFGIGVNKSSFLCLKAMKNEPCPICEELERQREAGATREQLSVLNAWPPRYLFLIINMTSKKTIEDGVQVWEAPNSINKRILDLSSDPRTHNVVDISDLDTGKDLYFKRVGTGIQTRYEGHRIQDRNIPITDEMIASIDGMPELEDFLIFATYAEIKEEFEKGIPVPTTEDVDNAAPEFGEDQPDAHYVEDNSIGSRVRDRLASQSVEQAPEVVDDSPDAAPEPDKEKPAPVTRTRRRRG